MISNTNSNIYVKKKIIIPLNEEEIKYYKKIFGLLDYEKKGKIKKEFISYFIKDSGLNDVILNQILSLNFQKDKNYIDKNEFFIILRLIAMAQKNIPISLDLVENPNLKLNLPFFSFLQESNLLKKQNLFEISENEIKSYLEIFYDKRDTKKQYISKLSAILVWSQKNPNGIKDNEKILESLEPLNKDHHLNLKEFIVGCYLVYLSKIIKMPIKLPDNLLKYLGRPSNIYINNNNSNIKQNNINTNTNNNIKPNNINTNIHNNLHLGFINPIFGQNTNLNNQENNKKVLLNQNQSNQKVNKINEQMIKDMNINNINQNLNTNNSLKNMSIYNSNTEINNMYNLIQQAKEKEAKYQLNSKADTKHSSIGSISQNSINNTEISQTLPTINTSSVSFLYYNNYDNNYINNFNNISSNNLYESNRDIPISNSQYLQLQNNNFNQNNANYSIQPNPSFFKQI